MNKFFLMGALPKMIALADAMAAPSRPPPTGMLTRTVEQLVQDFRFAGPAVCRQSRAEIKQTMKAISSNIFPYSCFGLVYIPVLLTEVFRVPLETMLMFPSVALMDALNKPPSDEALLRAPVLRLAALDVDTDGSWALGALMMRKFASKAANVSLKTPPTKLPGHTCAVVAGPNIDEEDSLIVARKFADEGYAVATVPILGPLHSERHPNRNSTRLRSHPAPTHNHREVGYDINQSPCQPDGMSTSSSDDELPLTSDSTEESVIAVRSARSPTASPLVTEPLLLSEYLRARLLAEGCEKLDVLVLLVNPLANVTTPTPTTHLLESELEANLDHVFWGNVRFLQASLPLLDESSAGRVVVVSPWKPAGRSLVKTTDFGHAVAKAALDAYLQQLKIALYQGGSATLIKQTSMSFCDWEEKNVVEFAYCDANKEGEMKVLVNLATS